MKAFLEKEREKVKKNQLKNKPLVLMTYMFVLIFIGMFGYLIYFMVKDDTEQVVANTSNKRQDSFEKFVIRGDIITSDGVVLATTNVDEEGNETRYYPYGSLLLTLLATIPMVVRALNCLRTLTL